MNDNTNTSAAQAAALRAAADFIETHPDLPRPYVSFAPAFGAELNYFLHVTNAGDCQAQRAAAEAIIAAIDEGWVRAENTTETSFRCRHGELAFHLIVAAAAEYEQVLTTHNPIVIPKAVTA